MRLLLCAAWAAAWAGAGGGCRRSGLAVSGDVPYVRCLMASPPDLDGRRIGSVVLKQEDRALTLRGLNPPVTIAAFSGPAFAAPPGPVELEALRAAKPQLVLVLGGAGDQPATAEATLAALAQLPVPTLLLAGGRDRLERIARALDRLGSGAQRIVDITALRTVRLAGDTFIPVAGAFAGSYALDGQACGYDARDLDEVESELDLPDGGRRWLLAWEAPRGKGAYAVTATETGERIGSPALAEFAASVGAGGGLFAWPEVQAMRPSAAGGERRAEPGQAAADLQLVVPRWTGPAVERSDGSRVPAGFALLRLDRDGLRLLSAPVPP